jgi:hypothetical protein
LWLARRVTLSVSAWFAVRPILFPILCAGRNYVRDLVERFILKTSERCLGSLRS